MKEKIIKTYREDLQFLEEKEPMNYDLKLRSDYRLIIRVLYPMNIHIYNSYHDCFLKLSDNRRIKDKEYLVIQFHGDLYFKNFSDGTTRIEKEYSQYDVIIDENAKLRYESIGEMEFLKECNEFRYKNILTVRKNLENTWDKIDPGEPEFISYNKQIEILRVS